MTAFSVHCAICGLYFDDVVARSEHIEHSLNHPRCGSCCRRFLNQNSLSLHLQCAAAHSVPEDEHGGDILECAEVILTWLNDSATSFDAAEIEQGSEKDFWSSEIDTDNDSTESENEFEDSEPEVEQYKDRMISMGECEEGSTYNELLFKNLVDMSEISESCHCLSVAESKPTHLYIDERNRVVEPNRRL